jgi:hypothetical protein
MMKNIVLFILMHFITLGVFAQGDPVLIIDGVNTTFKAGVSLPYWMKSGQTIDLGTNALSVSAIEFKADSSVLKFNRAVIINGAMTVPAGMVWKLEAIGLASNTSSGSGGSTGTTYGPQLSNNGVLSLFQSPKEFTIPGQHSWMVPPGVTRICVELWGAGGNGGTTAVAMAAARGGSGGGSGAYGYECLNVVPGTIYNLIVGAGGGDTLTGFSSFSTLFKAYAGKNASGVIPGVGGTANMSYTQSGYSGLASPIGNTGVGGRGADAPNGGFGGKPSIYGNAYSGTYPGGGGGGSFNGGTYNNMSAGFGADGKVVISW